MHSAAASAAVDTPAVRMRIEGLGINVVPGEQRTMMHLDLQVQDLDAAVADAVALGARVAEFQPQDNGRVLLDPAGHPVCLCLDEEG